MTERSDKFILIINGGSSSLKFSLFKIIDTGLTLSGVINNIGESKCHFKATDKNGKVILDRPAKNANQKSAAKSLINYLKSEKYYANVTAIGHRIVQGGPNHREPLIITNELLESLEQLIYLAPNHLPGELKTIKAFQIAFPGIPQIACFDTSFHKHMPDYVKYYPLPDQYKDMGLMKYGFHGLSYQYILQKLIKEDLGIIKKKIIVAHLGNGASMVAINAGISIDTTMGMSPIGGLIMSSRSGDLDPGAILFLLKKGKLTPNQLDKLLSKNSGLMAISGRSDIQQLLETELVDTKAADAITVFCYTAKKFIGSLAAAMGGLDLLVFTGGIGENSALIRERICKGLEFLGIDLTAESSPVAVRVIPTNEELMIAVLATALLKRKNPDGTYN